MSDDVQNVKKKRNKFVYKGEQLNRRCKTEIIAFPVHINHISIQINHSKIQFNKLFSLVIQFNIIKIYTHFQNFLIKCPFTITMYLFILIKFDLIANVFSIEKCRDIPMNMHAPVYTFLY